MVSPKSPFRTLQDLVDHARKNPGELEFAGSGIGTSSHFAKIKFDRMSGLTTRYKPYRGTASTLSALVRKEVPAMWGALTTALQLKGKVRILAVSTPRRHPLFPKVPTFAELDYPLVGGAWRGMAVPDTTEEEICFALSDVMEEVVADAEYREEMMAQGFYPSPVNYEDMEYFMDEKTDEYLMNARAARIIQ
jgi:tripartite-type tricarboxylate transporter receptor subunit TctC